MTNTERYMRDLARAMREERIASYSDGRISVTLDASAFAPAPAEMPAQPPQPIGVENGGMPTDEQLLMWSAGGELPKARKEEVPS